MRRLCTESSRSYTPQGGTELSPGRSVCRSVRAGVSVITVISEAPCMATHTVSRQKSAEGIVVPSQRDEGPNVEVRGGLP